MKTRLIPMIVLLAMSGVAIAERPPAGPPPMNIDRLEILLDLDAYQKQQVQSILDAQRETMRAKRQQMRESNTRPSIEERRKERETARTETRAKLQTVLTEQQMRKFDVLTERSPRSRARKAY